MVMTPSSTLSRERHLRSKEIFLELCALSKAEQLQRLNELDEDDALVEEVESLLAFYEEPEPDELEPTSSLGSAAEASGLSDFSSGLLESVDIKMAPGTLVGRRYRIIRPLGQGGMGTIYEAEDLTLGARVALKFLLQSSKTRQLLNEVRSARQVTHPNICRVFDLGEIDGSPFISMEYVDGEDLRSLLNRIGRVPRNRTVLIARQLFSGLAAAHAKGVLHRDLKPANIMIDGRGEVRITDFGIAVDTRSGERASNGAGTPAFMAPECLEGNEPTEKSDIYSLGLVLYEMCTGVYPFDASSRLEHRAARFSQTPAPPSSRIDDIDPLLERIILKCLEVTPEDRPSSALAVAAALPGGDDPLSLAVSIGETPSPEMVAEAGSRGVMEPRRAGLLASLAALFVILAVLSADSARQMDSHDLALPPEVLAEKAREHLRDLGWDEAAQDEAYGYLSNTYALDTRKTAPESDDPIFASKHPGTSSILFWYRQSPVPMVPSGLFNLEMGGTIWTYDPPLDRGMAMVLLHPSGRIDHLEIAPESAGDETPAPEEPVIEPDLSVILKAAGLDPQLLERKPAKFTPPFFADYRAAFVGPSPGRDDFKLDVRIASLGGKVTYFRMFPDIEPEEKESGWLARISGLWDQSWSLIFVLCVLASIPMTRRNLRRGRGDRRGAKRLAVFVSALTFALSTLRGPHFVDIHTQWSLVQIRVGQSLLAAGLAWLLYLAVEPYVRRVWPQTLIAWSRLLAGRFRDPLVGTSVLYGVVFGAAWTLVDHLDFLLPGFLGLTPAPRTVDFTHLEVALKTGSTLASFGDLLIGGVTGAIVSLLLLVLLKMLLPRPWLAAIAYVAIVSGLYAQDGGHPILSWLTLGVTVATLEAVMLVRFGLVTFTVAAAVNSMLYYFPLTLDISMWYADAGVLAVLATGALTVFAVNTALEPRRTMARNLPSYSSNSAN